MACFILGENNVMFIHIPKTGGRALSNELSNQGKVSLTIPGHLTIKDLLIGKSIRTFSIVRNPYDRMVSIYRHCYERDIENTSTKTFEEFVKNVKNSFQSAGFALNHLPHINSQSFWVCDWVGNVIVDDIIKYESYDTDVIKYLNEKNIDVTFIPKFRVGDKSIKAELTDEVKKIIYEIYKSDFINFNYKK